MKQAIIILASVCFMAALAAYKINGTDSMAIGDSAGKYAMANRTVAIGNGAGAYIVNCDSNMFVGVASGVLANTIKETSGFGHYALRNATNVFSSVAIGDNAMRGAIRVKNCVAIGQGVMAWTQDATNSVNINNQFKIEKTRNELSRDLEELVEIRDVNGEAVIDARRNLQNINDTGRHITLYNKGGWVYATEGEGIYANTIYLTHAPYLKKVGGKIHVFINDEDLGYITLSK